MSIFGMLRKVGLEASGDDLEVFDRALRLTGDAKTPDTTEITVLLNDTSGDVLLATGTIVPTADEDGFAKGCLFIKTDAADGTSGLYNNEGTTSNADFSQL